MYYRKIVVPSSVSVNFQFVPTFTVEITYRLAGPSSGLLPTPTKDHGRRRQPGDHLLLGSWCGRQRPVAGYAMPILVSHSHRAAARVETGGARFASTRLQGVAGSRQKGAQNDASPSAGALVRAPGTTTITRRGWVKGRRTSPDSLKRQRRRRSRNKRWHWDGASFSSA